MPSPTGPLTYKLFVGNGGAYLYLFRVTDDDSSWRLSPYDETNINAVLNTSGKMWPDPNEDPDKWEPAFPTERLIIVDVVAAIPRIGNFDGSRFYDYGVIRPRKIDDAGEPIPYPDQVEQLRQYIAVEPNGAKSPRVLVTGLDLRLVGLIRGEGLILDPGMTVHLCPEWVVVDESPPAP